jgi:hypothetical protein
MIDRIIWLGLGFAQKVLKPVQRSLNENNILAQRRKGAKKSLRNAVTLCAFASLRLCARDSSRQSYFCAKLLASKARKPRPSANPDFEAKLDYRGNHVNPVKMT